MTRMRKDPPVIDTLLQAQRVICDAIHWWYHGNQSEIPAKVKPAIKLLRRVVKNPYGNRI